MRPKVVVVCPGRGSYTANSFETLKNRPKSSEFLQKLDDFRKSRNEFGIRELDSMKFSPAIHTKGEHASLLIYACSLADFHALDSVDVVAVLGNSMGHYSALHVAGAVDERGACQLIHTMGSMMKEKLIGGQIIFPLVDTSWKWDESKVKVLKQSMEKVLNKNEIVALSIELGGYAVIGGSDTGLRMLLKELPKIDQYPFRLLNHGAFHTCLMEDVSEKAFSALPIDLFKKPQIPLIDGRGKIWYPHSTKVENLYRYTLGHQVVAPFSFTRAVTVALKEFAPDYLILLGPGETLGGSIAQILIQNSWKGIRSKIDFIERQKENPFLISMVRNDQKKHLEKRI